MKLRVNNQNVTFQGDEEMPLLWYLREHLRLIGTKFGCGIGSCGACTVHVDGSAVRACSIPMSALDGREVTTIEALSQSGQLNPVQQAWLELNVPQCGYCQAGQIMAITDFLSRFPDPTDADIDQHLDNLCRCGTYTRIRQGVHRAAELQRKLDKGVSA